MRKSFLIVVAGIIAMLFCTDCKHKTVNPVSVPPAKRKLELREFLKDCSMQYTGSNDAFNIKITVLTNVAGSNQGTPVYMPYRTYTNLTSSSNSNYTTDIEIPPSGIFYIDVVVESGLCVKCCPLQSCSIKGTGMVSLQAHEQYNWNTAIPNPIVITSFIKVCS